MKISLVLPFVNLTGGIRVMLDYANWLHAAGHETTVVYPCWPYRFQFTRQQQWMEFRKQLLMEPRVAWFDLKCRLLRVPVISTMFLPRADLVVATAWPTAHDVARLHRSRGSKVHIVMHHESGTGPEDRIRAIYALPFHRVAFSHFVRDTIEARFGCDIPEVVPNGVDTTLYFRDAPADSNTVLMLYHPDPRKGANDGIQALTRLRALVPGLEVRVCGTVRPDRPLPSWMSFEFHPDDATIRRRYSTATVFLYPSRYEGYGLPPLEAMACGCPVVTTEVGAVGEFASDGESAFIVPVGDVDAMVDRLARLIRDPGLRQRLSLNGRLAAERLALARVAPLFCAALERAARLE